MIGAKLEGDDENENEVEREGGYCDEHGAPRGAFQRMNAPNLQALQRGDPEAWEEAFRWLWPVAFAAAQFRLQAFLPQDVEDVAIEALEALVEKVREMRSVEELKPLAASIAHHKAVSGLRAAFSDKRGRRQTESLDEHRDEAGDRAEISLLLRRSTLWRKKSSLSYCKKRSAR